MDLENFKQSVVPAKRRGRLEAHAQSIAELVKDGYSVSQVTDWLNQQFLADGSTTITRQAVAKWWRRHGGRIVGGDPATSPAAVPARTDDLSNGSYETLRTEPSAPLPVTQPEELNDLLSRPVDLEELARKRKKR